MITSAGLQKLGFVSHVDFTLQDDGDGAYIAQWNSDQPQPTEAEIKTAHAEWQAEYDSQEYARKRKAEYPSIEECVHAILDDDLDALQAKRAEIKARFPK
tara:strand:- start:114 stop:413 length:300 start_codon:yes stop_codon:yes gene_type:complete